RRGAPARRPSVPPGRRPAGASRRGSVAGAPARPGPEERVLQLLPGLPQVAAPFLGPAFRLQAPVTGHLARVPLDPAAQLPGLVVHLVRKSHRGTSSRREYPFPVVVTDLL